MYMYFLALFFSQANKPISYEGLQLRLSHLLLYMWLTSAHLLPINNHREKICVAWY